jgi:hypothetical protein
MTLLIGGILLAIAATLMSLVFGVSSMATGRQIAHHNSDEWMHLRVAFQAVAVLLLLVAIAVK